MAGHSSGRSARLLSSLRLSWLCALWALLLAVLFITGSGPILRRANSLGRRCATGNFGRFPAEQLRIAMVSCSTSKTPPSVKAARDFQGFMEMVTPNKQRYAKMRGYDFIDASEELDMSRPPSWSKILAVQRHLHKYDWVFWNDADSLVMNFGISLEEVLGDTIGDDDSEDLPDLVLTTDVNGVNAGMFFIRNSIWSQYFLDTWWNQTSFIQEFGLTKSGDNDALKHLVSSFSPEELREHVRIARMQCLFNSYPWFPSLKTILRLLKFPRATWQGAYSDGDFMVHLAGLDDKKKWARRFLAGESGEEVGLLQAHRGSGNANPI